MPPPPQRAVIIDFRGRARPRPSYKPSRGCCARRRFPWLELMWTDGGYNAWQVDAAVAKVPLLRMEIVKRSDDMKGFIVLPLDGREHLLLVRPKPASR